MKRSMLVVAALAIILAPAYAAASHPIDFELGPGLDFTTTVDSTGAIPGPDQESLWANLTLLYHTKNDQWAFGVRAETATNESKVWDFYLAARAKINMVTGFLGAGVWPYVGLDLGAMSVDTKQDLGAGATYGLRIRPSLGCRLDMGGTYFDLRGMTVHDLNAGGYQGARGEVALGFKLGGDRPAPH